MDHHHDRDYEAYDEKSKLLDSSVQQQDREYVDEGEGIVIDDSHKQNVPQSIISIIKAVVGAGSFALPYGVLNAGYIGGGIGILLLGIVCAYTTQVLVNCKNRIVWRKPKKYVTYPDCVEELLGKVAGIFLYVALVITSLGACSAYLVFCGTMFNSIEYLDVIPLRGWVPIIGIPLIFLTWLRSFRYLSFTSILGDICLLLGFTVVFYLGFKHGFQPASELSAFEFRTFPNFFGAAAFLFCTHFLMLPIEQSLKEPSKFPLSLTTSYIIVTILNLFFAVLGYLFYGSGTQQNILLNLGSGALVTVTKIALSLDLFFTFLVVFVPARDVLEETLSRNVLHPHYLSGPHFMRFIGVEARINILRTVLVLICMGIACSVTEFSTLLDLISGISLSACAFIFPSAMLIRLEFMNTPIEMRRFKFYALIVLHCVIIFVGFLAAFLTTTISIKNLACEFRPDFAWCSSTKLF